MVAVARSIPPDSSIQILATDLARQDLPVWMLVDPALGDAPATTRLAQKLGWPRYEAFATSPLNTFGVNGPALLQLPRLNPTALSDALRQWIKLDTVAVGLSWVVSTAAVIQLQDLFAYLALATVDGDTPLHCRCADARVLPPLLRVLSPPQAARVGSLVASWQWLDAVGTGVTWSAAGTPREQPDSADHLQLNAQQYSMLMDASEPDIMFALLIDKTPEVVPEENRGTFRQKLARILNTATRYNVGQTPDRLQFVVLSLSCGESFHEHPGLRETWRAVSARGARLSKEMEGWSDDLWTSLEESNKALR